MSESNESAEQKEQQSQQAAQASQQEGDQSGLTWAQRAAANDRAFGVLPEHMADFYDNEHRAEMRGRERKGQQ